MSYTTGAVFLDKGRNRISDSNVDERKKDEKPENRFQVQSWYCNVFYLHNV